LGGGKDTQVRGIHMGRDPPGPKQGEAGCTGEEILGGGQDAQVRGIHAGKRDVCAQVRPDWDLTR